MHRLWLRIFMICDADYRHTVLDLESIVCQYRGKEIVIIAYEILIFSGNQHICIAALPIHSQVLCLLYIQSLIPVIKMKFHNQIVAYRLILYNN